MQRIHATTASAATLMLAAGLAAPAIAQQTPQDEPSAVLDEVIVTNQPAFEDSGRLTARAGRFGEYGVEGVVNSQMDENSTGRLAFRYTTNNGYAEHVPTGEELEGGTSWGVRGTVLHTTGPWKFVVGLDYSEDDMDGHARIPVATASTAPAFVALINSLRNGPYRAGGGGLRLHLPDLLSRQQLQLARQPGRPRTSASSARNSA